MSLALHGVAESHEVLPACRRLSPDLVLIDGPAVAGPLGLLADVAAADLPWPPALLLVADDPDGRMRDQALGLGPGICWPNQWIGRPCWRGSPCACGPG
ncbi:hypothetical protein HHL28_10305 [Aerophototrophica crusticola]|uniref:Response regulatory domain-containing protein n=1 Tax=Aerophototrophica crusticola TaxID=1709002 RepID=A0A858R7N2_9PROT|nr:hypothetical protein HHL28_10305 [Rhodospirillaceae bacterium B3]